MADADGRDQGDIPVVRGAGRGAAEPALALLGVDHHRSPVEVREKLALPPEATDRLYAALRKLEGVSEVLILSTCNRLECYLAGAPQRPQIIALLGEFSGVTLTQLEEHAYWHAGTAGVRHLFRVVSGLESLVIGEHQIVNQVKDAYDLALSLQVTGPVLNPLIQRALSVGKDVRTTTEIGKHKLSVASVAVDLARHIHDTLGQARLLVVGAGEIAELALRYLLSAGVRELGIINRSHERAVALANQYSAKALPWTSLSEAIGQYDIIITSTAAPHAVITEQAVRQAIKHRRAPMMFIDLAVPRDVEPSVGKIADVFLYNIDHLEAVVAANRSLRREDVEVAAALVDSQVGKYLHEERRDKGALMAQIAQYFDDVIAVEDKRLAGKLPLTAGNAVRYGLERVGHKLQHQILRVLRENPDDPELERFIRKLLNLE